MPVPNDLTPEDEAMFAQHGVSTSGPGKEPIVESDADIQQQDQQQADEQHGDRQQDVSQTQQRSERPRDPTTGRFLSAEEIAAQQQSENDNQQQQQQSDNRTVPLAALHQERMRAGELARRAQLAEARMNAMLTRQQGQQQKQQLPDLNEDPVGYITALEQRLSQFEQERTVDQQTRQLDMSIEQDENLFKQTQPDYDMASDYYVQSRAQELLQFYTPQDAQKIMMQEAREVAQQAWQRGQSAGEVIYRLAMARGYNPNRQGQYQTEQHQQGNSQPNRPNAAETVKNIRTNQQQNRSLSNAGGNAGAGALNAAALLEMSDDEFEDYLKLGAKGANARFAAIG